MTSAGFYKDKKKKTRIIPERQSNISSFLVTSENDARKTLLKQEPELHTNKDRVSLSEAATAALIGPKGMRLRKKYDTDGAHLFERFDMDRFNHYSVWQGKDGRFFIWLDTPGGSRVTGFGKDKDRMLSHLNQLKDSIMHRQLAKATTVLKSKRDMAAYMVKNPNDVDSIPTMIAREISKAFLADSEFQAFRLTFENDRRKGDPADDVLAEFIEKERIVRNLP